MSKPKFYQAELIEITENVLDFVYPDLKGENQSTMKERMGDENATCPECGHNEWWLYPKESIMVKEGGKPYIECKHCGYITHL